MKQLFTGEFFGETNERIYFDGITLTDTEYTHSKVDWHYHENAYFTFILQGFVKEINKKETYTCTPGTLLFHNWQEPHYNIKPPGFTRGFHIEVKQSWIQSFLHNTNGLYGNLNIADPSLKILLYKIFKETKKNDASTALATEDLLLQLFTGLQKVTTNYTTSKPKWVAIVRELLHESYNENLSLSLIAKEANIHPIHLSRDFQKHFYCSIGEYVRKLKVTKSLSLLPVKQHSLSSISFECGFADQSHFIRCFKEYTGISPLAYRKLL